MEDHLNSADPLVAFDRAIGKVIGKYVPTTVLRSTSGDEQWFDASCQRAYDARRLLNVPGVEHVMRNFGVNLCLLVLRPRGSMVLEGNRIMSAPGII